jgi:hypothetical protein
MTNRAASYGSYSDAVMSHDGMSIDWNYSAFKKQQGKEASVSVGLFEEINAYWAQIDPARQGQIFSVYSRVKEAFDLAENTKALTTTLVPLLQELYELHPLEELDHWVRYHSDIRIPDKIIEKFVESDDLAITRQKTYTKDDYHKLLVLALALRAVVPVWGELISFTEKHKILGTNWKEYSAYQLLNRTSLMYCEAMQKLRGYVNAYVPTDKAKRPHSAILAGIGSEDFPEWLLGVIVFRRVCIGDIRNTNPESHLVSSVHSYILSRLSPSESSFIGHVREKNNRRETGDDDNKLSRLEGYKIRQELPEGDVAIIAHAAKDTHVLARQVSPTVPLELVDQIHAVVHAELLSRTIQQPQLTIMQWVMARAIKPRGLQYLAKDRFLNCLAVTTAVLLHHGHTEIAGLVSAKSDDTNAEMAENIISGHGRISQKNLDELARLYPYQLLTSSKQQRESGKTQISAVLSINLVADQLDDYGWTLTLPSEYVKLLQEGHFSRRYSMPRSIRDLLATLVIRIATRSL